MILQPKNGYTNGNEFCLRFKRMLLDKVKLATITSIFELDLGKGYMTSFLLLKTFMCFSVCNVILLCLTSI